MGIFLKGKEIPAGKSPVRTQQVGPVYSQEEVSADTKPDSSLLLDFEPPEGGDFETIRGDNGSAGGAERRRGVGAARRAC